MSETVNEKQKPAVSVIVPIYNVEKYLRQCLNSIVGQTLNDLEIILINDGSKDGSLEIIKAYAEKDRRIKVIDKPNEGYGKTMNRGIEAATGEYIGIVESDDWIAPDMYETLYGIAKQHNVDVAKSSFFLFDDKSGDKQLPSREPAEDAEKVIIPRQNTAIFCFKPSVWSAIYRREFLNNYNIRFLETPGASFQDTSFSFKVLAMANTVYFTMKPLVYYRVGHSVQSSLSKDKIFSICGEYEEVERFMASNPILFKRLEKVFYRMKYISYRWNLYRLDGENREKFREQMRDELMPFLKRNAIDFMGRNSNDKVELLIEI